MNMRKSPAKSLGNFICFNDRCEYRLFLLEESVKSEASGDIQKGLLAIVRCIRSRPHFFAEQLRKAMKVCSRYFSHHLITN